MIKSVKPYGQTHVQYCVVIRFNAKGVVVPFCVPSSLFIDSQLGLHYKLSSTIISGTLSVDSTSKVTNDARSSKENKRYSLVFSPYLPPSSIPQCVIRGICVIMGNVVYEILCIFAKVNIYQVLHILLHYDTPTPTPVFCLVKLDYPDMLRCRTSYGRRRRDIVGHIEH